MFHVERVPFMNSVEAKLLIGKGEVTEVNIVAALDEAKWIVMFKVTDEDYPWRYMTRARGGSARFSSIDAAHTAVRRVGWYREIQLSV